ncbi:type IV pilin [Natrarchaeobius chitinivorans]|uniref:Type IV pilin n=1 Tax=Natrarchaeobius chitinivorans TaxID=1679083 RepID=A0A3N6P4R1_NATCH|nr:type IV pilin N-terminal domain-containing protein [Natrarchaeobius chitinivorans]RQG90415.1 type IV pilin [Natrarchaeobius chitinivorans]
MDVKTKYVEADDLRAVSPVIGVILMVAITVILAAVIAAFVMDLGGSIGQEAQAGVSITVDDEAEEVRVSVTSLGNADHVNLTTGAVDDELTWENADTDLLTVGDVTRLAYEDGGGGSLEESGTLAAVAVINASDTETMVASEDWDFIVTTGTIYTLIAQLSCDQVCIDFQWLL